jgi:uncharacterized repeat protein (TIGR01451 family)
MKRLFAMLGATAVLAGISTAVASADGFESADVGVSVSSDQSSYKAGDLITYTLKASDYGPADAEDVVLTDVLPAGTQLVSVTPVASSPWTVDSAVSDLGLSAQTTTSTLDSGSDPSGYDSSSFAGRTKVTVVLGHLGSALYSSADESTATVQIVVRATSSGSLVDDATVSAVNPDPNVADNNYAGVTATVG